MLKTMFVHIGTGKTGTTAIQRTMYASRRFLRGRRFFYPSNMPNHHFLVSRFIASPDRMEVNRRAGLSGEAMQRHISDQIREFEAEMRSEPFKVGIISSEYFDGLDSGACEQLRAYLEKFAKEIRIICYVRHPLAHAASYAQQIVKHGGMTFADIDTKMRRPPYFSFAQRLPKWIDAFGREAMIVRPFERERLKDQDVVADFAQVIGYGGKLRPLKQKAVNESLSMPAALVADALAGLAPVGSPERGKLFYLRQIKGPKFRLTRAMAERVLAESADDLAYLEREFGLTLANPDDGVYAEDIEPVFTLETVRSLAQILNGLTLEISRLENENARLESSATGQTVVERGAAA